MKRILSLLSVLLVVSCASEQAVYEHDREPSDQRIARYRENVSVKEQNEKFIVYEYKDVRVDELFTFARQHCFDATNKSEAFLKEVILYRNHLRRATFECPSLAKE